MKKVCPRCGNYLMLGVLKQTGEKVLVCDEDEGLWLVTDLELTGLNNRDMQTYLESQGLEPTWDSIKIIEEIADI